MRPLYAVQFEITRLANAIDEPSVSETVTKTVAGWISEWYSARKSIDIVFPALRSIYPVPHHEVSITSDFAKNQPLLIR